MQIFADTDTCPVVHIVEVAAQKYDVAVTLLCDTNNRFPESFEKLIRRAVNSDFTKSLTKMDGQIIL